MLRMGGNTVRDTIPAKVVFKRLLPEKESPVRIAKKTDITDELVFSLAETKEIVKDTIPAKRKATATKGIRSPGNGELC